MGKASKQAKRQKRPAGRVKMPSPGPSVGGPSAASGPSSDVVSEREYARRIMASVGLRPESGGPVESVDLIGAVAGSEPAAHIVPESSAGPVPAVASPEPAAHIGVAPVESGDMVLTGDEVAKLLKVGRATFYRLVKVGRIPGRIDVPGMPVRYLRRSVVAWIESVANK